MCFHLSHRVSYSTPIADRIFEPADHTWLRIMSVLLMQAQLWQRSVPDVFCGANQGGQGVVSIARSCVSWSFMSVVENTSITPIRRTISTFIFCWVHSRLIVSSSICLSSAYSNTKLVADTELVHGMYFFINTLSVNACCYENPSKSPDERREESKYLFRGSVGWPVGFSSAQEGWCWRLQHWSWNITISWLKLKKLMNMIP